MRGYTKAQCEREEDRLAKILLAGWQVVNPNQRNQMFGMLFWDGKDPDRTYYAFEAILEIDRRSKPFQLAFEF